MGAQVKRVRDASGNITTLNLQSADPAQRRLDVLPGTDCDLSTRFLGFYWTKSAGASVDIEVQRVDLANGNKVYPIEKVTGDTTLNGAWTPPNEELSGLDAQAPRAAGFGWRLQFSQAGSACLVDAVAVYKGV